VLGQATYTDDIPEVRGTLHAALGLSSKAHARITSLDLDAVRAAPGVVAVYTVSDIPGTNDCGPIIHDDPILADGLVQYVGQPIFIVVADSHANARRAAKRGVVGYEELPAILTPQQAKSAASYANEAAARRCAGCVRKGATHGQGPAVRRRPGTVLP
jgi:xanthine dehydrogenase large subunit